LTFVELPAEGYRGRVPDFPLPRMAVLVTKGWGEDRTTVEDKTASLSLRRREMAAWREAWATPQAAAWSQPRWAWLHPTIGEFCRLKALVERAPNASLIAQLHRYRDQIGLTKAGMRELGWDVVADQVAQRREKSADTQSQPVQEDRRRRLMAAPGA
jgi:hypothetical protein